MNFKSNLKYFWLAVAALSLALTISMWLGCEWENLQNAILVLDALMLVLAVPCSLFAALVVWLANHYLGINPFSSEGVSVATVFLVVTGAMQWFWIARFWSPTEAVYQNLNLVDAETR